MFIAYQVQGGIQYARLMESYREGNKIKKRSGANLGRVLDRERGIYQSKERGVFTYNLETNEYGPAPQDFVNKIQRKNAKEKLIVDFGDAYLIDTLIDQFGLREAIHSIDYKNPDSVSALLLYYIIQKRSNAHASIWLEGSYATQRYPNANLTSQRISDLLSSIGDENNVRAFFNAYFAFLGKETCEGANILIDSTGLPNSIRFPLTAVNNHNGQISEEVRLIYVVQQKTRLPIYMRYVSGNVVDTTTLITTISELKESGVNTKFAILDAGYMTEDGIKHLYDNNVSFLVRCPKNRNIYKKAIEAGLANLESAENIAVDEEGKLFNGRQVYVRHVEVEYNGMKLHAYVGRDKTMQEQERQKAVQTAACSNARLDKDELHRQLQEFGLFVLLSTRQVRADLVLSHYYIRQDVEQIFDISKNYASLLPLNVQKEETFRGHLLLTFIATVVLQMLQNQIRKSPFSIDRILTRMQTQKAKVFDHCVIPAEPVKEQSEIYKILKIKCPRECSI